MWSARFPRDPRHGGQALAPSGVRAWEPAAEQMYDRDAGRRAVARIEVMQAFRLGFTKSLNPGKLP